MTSRKLFIITAIIIGVLVLLAGGALLLVKVLVTPEMIRKNVLPRVEKAMDRRIDMADAKIGLFSGIALSGLKVYEKDGKGPFVSLREARLHYQILPLLSRRVVVDEIVLDTPDIHIVRNSDGSFNFSDLLRKEKPETPAREEKTPFSFAVARIKVSDGRVIYDDRKGISGKPFVFKAQDINIGVKNFTPDRPLSIFGLFLFEARSLRFNVDVTIISAERWLAVCQPPSNKRRPTHGSGTSDQDRRIVQEKLA